MGPTSFTSCFSLSAALSIVEEEGLLVTDTVLCLSLSLLSFSFVLSALSFSFSARSFRLILASRFFSSASAASAAALASVAALASAAAVERAMMAASSFCDGAVGRTAPLAFMAGEGVLMGASRVGVAGVAESFNLNSLGESMGPSSDGSRVRFSGLSIALPLRTIPSYCGIPAIWREFANKSIDWWYDAPQPLGSLEQDLMLTTKIAATLIASRLANKFHNSGSNVPLETMSELLHRPRPAKVEPHLRCESFPLCFD